MNTAACSPSDLTQIIIFTRYPEPGTTKTRLIPAIGSENAALLQKKMTEKIVATARAEKLKTELPLAIYYHGGNEAKMHQWLGDGHYFKQITGDLGVKMTDAYIRSFAAGAQQALVLGSDIPGIDTLLLQKAMCSLAPGKVVLGPSLDGGYYLIGFTKDDAPRLYPQVFEELEWSTPSVFKTTCQRICDLGLNLITLPPLRDIDTLEDLEYAKEQGLL